MTTPYRKKMIEVAIPLDAINKEAAREKSIRHGHPSTLHLWWARRPLAACRAVLFTSLIDDPGEEGVPKELLAKIDELPSPPDHLDSDTITDTRRKKLFAFIGELVKWESTTDEQIIGKARELIMAATDGNPPPVLDPFCGGGSIPLEAQRLGLQAYASDLNPVAVLITKALIEIPPKFAGQPPVNPDDRAKMGSGVAWKGAAGLAADVRYYGKWMRDRAFERIGHLYPKGPNGETVIAWLWARTVRCPNPACGGQMPLVRSFWLSTKKGKEAWVEPIVDKVAKSVRFVVHNGPGEPRAGTKERAKVECLICEASVSEKQLREQASGHGYGELLMAVVTDGDRRRNYVEASPEQIPAVEKPATSGLNAEVPRNPRWFSPPAYGLTTYADLFTPRQLVALTTFSDLVAEARDLIRKDAAAAGLPDDDTGIDAGGTGSQAYAEAVATYLAFAVDKAAQRNNSLCSWEIGMGRLFALYGRQAMPMVWDFAETNPFGGAGGDLYGTVHSLSEVLDTSLVHQPRPGVSKQLDATSSVNGAAGSMMASDPPYYDNVGYADLSDFFYVWMRRALSPTYPTTLSTLLTPKDQELIATPYRFGGSRQRADAHFEKGLAQAFERIRETAPREFPLTLYYAFRQLEAKDGASAVQSTGWEKMLSGLIGARFEVLSTWPIRTELVGALKKEVNALASSVVLACRPQPDKAPLSTLKDFQQALKAELPDALRHLIGGHIAPVDLAQAAIGPGMAVFSRYSKVLEPNGDPMTVRRALELINAALDEYFSELEGSFDGDTQFCTAWFDQHRFNEGPYGQALVLAQAKNVGIDGLDRDGVLKSGGGKVALHSLVHYTERVASYDPAADPRLSAWEACHYLAAALRAGGEAEAAKLARRLGGVAETARDLAYRLYSICERKKWSDEGRAYNELVASWPEIQKAAAALDQPTQGSLN